MSDYRRPQTDDVEHLMRNAQLRDELEPFFDESITRLNVAELPTPIENEYLASMLAWERAPVLPISQWFEPELRLPRPEPLTDAELRAVLGETIQKLYSQRIVLDFTDHLSDRQLYCVILRDILPSPEKKVPGSDAFLHWDCADLGGDPEVWLRYYATDDERSGWLENCEDEGQYATLPPHEEPPFRRTLPQRPL